MGFLFSHRDAMLSMGGIYEYIQSHHFGYWHKYVENVNMTYINCRYTGGQKFVDLPLPRYENTFTVLTTHKSVNINLLIMSFTMSCLSNNF